MSYKGQPSPKPTSVSSCSETDDEGEEFGVAEATRRFNSALKRQEKSAHREDSGHSNGLLSRNRTAKCEFSPASASSNDGCDVSLHRHRDFNGPEEKKRRAKRTRWESTQHPCVGPCTSYSPTAESAGGANPPLNIIPEPPPPPPNFDFLVQLPPPPPPPPSSQLFANATNLLPAASAFSFAGSLLPPPPPPPPLDLDDDGFLDFWPPSRVRNKSTAQSTAAGPWKMGRIDDYKIMKQVGEGTYGYVFKAVELATGRSVALKKVRFENEKEGFPITAVREIKILRQLQHPNVVNLLDIITDKQNAAEMSRGDSAFYLVFEYVDHDLMGLLESNMISMTLHQIASLMKQLLRALAFTHSHNFLHRDIKASNVLINNRGQLKLADYGLARLYNEKHRRLYTNHVITLWYRPPELLFGEERYGPSIDVWSAGCILAELFTKKPIFQGVTEMDQLEAIFRYCGTPTPTNWPGVEELPQYEVLKPKRLCARVIGERFSFIPGEPLNLLDRMLTLCPEGRITASDALDHAWMRGVEPTQIPPPQLPKHQDCHELWLKNTKRQQFQREA